MSEKSTKLEYDRRIRMVQEWMMQGYASSDIVRQCTTKWNISERQVYKYIKSAYEAFKAQEESKIEHRKAFHIATRMKLYRDLKEKEVPDQAKTALAILQDIAKLEGLYVEKIDHTTLGNPLQATNHVVIFKNYSEK